MIGLSVIDSFVKFIVSVLRFIVSVFKLGVNCFKLIVMYVINFLLSFRMIRSLLAAYFIFVSSFEDKRLRFSDREIDRRERMVQIYIVFMGLLLTYFKLVASDIGLFLFFNLFVICSIGYYSSFSSFMDSSRRKHLNLLALGVAFSFSICLCVVFFTLNGMVVGVDFVSFFWSNFSWSSLLFTIGFWVQVWCLLLSVYFSLYV